MYSSFVSGFTHLFHCKRTGHEIPMALQYYLPKVHIILCLHKVNNDNGELFYAQPIIGT